MLYAAVWVKIPQLSLRHDHQEFYQDKITYLLHSLHILFHYPLLSSFTVLKVILPHSRIRFVTTHEYHGDPRKVKSIWSVLGIRKYRRTPTNLVLCCASLLCSMISAGIEAMILTTTSTSLIFEGSVQSTYFITRLLFCIQTVPYDVRSAEAPWIWLTSPAASEFPLLSQGRLDDLSWWWIQSRTWLRYFSNNSTSLEESWRTIFSCHFNSASWNILSRYNFSRTSDL